MTQLVRVLDELEYDACVLLFFFFKQKTAYEIYQCDWSSDVCSSDLLLDLEIILDTIPTVITGTGAY